MMHTHTKFVHLYGVFPFPTKSHNPREVKAKSVKDVSSTEKGQSAISYEGTFITCDGALFTVPPADERLVAPDVGRKIEKRMLSVLFSKLLNARAGTVVADQCESPDVLQSGGFTTITAVTTHPMRGFGPAKDAEDRHFDCLLLLGGNVSVEKNRRVSARKVGISKSGFLIGGITMTNAQK